MIALNLLSPTQKEALRLRVLFAMIERLMILLSFGFLAAGLLLLSLRSQFVRVHAAVVARQLLSTEYVSVDNEVRHLNEVIGRIELIQREITPLPTLLIDLVERTPSGIQISNISFETKTKSLRLNGRAGTRESLLIYEERLRASPYLTMLESPISNLFEKRDINFSFQAIIDIDVLKKTLEPPATTTGLKS